MGPAKVVGRKTMRYTMNHHLLKTQVKTHPAKLAIEDVIVHYVIKSVKHQNHTGRNRPQRKPMGPFKHNCRNLMAMRLDLLCTFAPFLSENMPSSIPIQEVKALKWYNDWAECIRSSTTRGTFLEQSGKVESHFIITHGAPMDSK